MKRTILNAGLLDLCRDVNDAVQKIKRGVISNEVKKEWRELLLESEEICLGRRTVSRARLDQIERMIIHGAQYYNVKVRREQDGGSQPLARLEKTGVVGAATD